MAIKVRKLCKSFKKSVKTGNRLRDILFKKYIEIPAVKDVSFDIEDGEFVGFIGSNGAGKTTTLKMLSGLLHPDSGSVDILGFTPWKREREYLKQIALVMGQKNQLWWELPAIDSFELNKEIYEVEDGDYKKRLDSLLELLDLVDVVGTPVRKMSLGQRMKCELVVSLLHNPRVLFLDEPTIGLDVVMQRKLRDFFKDYNRGSETTVILTSHNMDDVKELCKRVIIIDKGSIIYDGELSMLVKKYVALKYIKLVFDSEVVKKDVERFGDVIDFDGISATLAVDRKDVARASAALLEKFSVEDLEITEMGLDDVVRLVFSEKNVI